jgi:Protein of unknown function (DUF2752)
VDVTRTIGVDTPRLRDTAIFVGGLAMAVTLHVADPSGATSFPVCPFSAITGLYCPGCGTLRSLHALLHADLRSAFGFNAVTVLLAPMLVVAWLSVGVAGIGGRRLPRLWNAPRWTGYAIAVAVGLFWILRNLPWAPFSWMAP